MRCVYWSHGNYYLQQENHEVPSNSSLSIQMLGCNDDRLYFWNANGHHKLMSDDQKK